MGAVFYNCFLSKEKEYGKHHYDGTIMGKFIDLHRISMFLFTPKIRVSDYVYITVFDLFYDFIHQKEE